MRTIEELLRDSTPAPWSYRDGAVYATPRRDNRRPLDDPPTEQPILQRVSNSIAAPWEKDANVQLASMAPAMLDGIRFAIGTIDAFDRACQAAEYTDTTMAWDIFHAIRAGLHDSLYVHKEQ
jgi:hypothetical protein